MAATNLKIDFGNREFRFGVSDQFVTRWSPRSFRKVEIPVETQRSILEAARWAPSCFNEQPWRIYTADSTDQFESFLQVLDPQNRSWAKRASIIGFIFGKKKFSYNDSTNRWSSFDCGAAWMSIALEARAKGYYAHCMAGFERDGAYSLLHIDKERYRAICAFVVGALDSPLRLEDKLRKDEMPSGRKSLGEIWKRNPLDT